MARDFEIIKFGDPVKGIVNGILQGNIKILSEVVTQTKALAPVKYGQLKNSYMWKVPGQSGGLNDSGGESAENEIDVNPKENEGYAGTALLHAIYQEFGTRYMKPQPHFRPSIDMIAKGTDISKVLAKIQEEEMKGPLKEGQKRVQF
jgi:hypothetical protein